MTIEALVNLVMTNGIGIVLVAYFIYKDYKFNENLLSVMGEMREVLAALNTWHSIENKTKE